MSSPRTQAANLAAKLVLAGARPVWCPSVQIAPLEDNEELDDALMRLAEYDVLVALSEHSIDALAERWLSLADGSEELVKAMIDASSVEIGTLGRDAGRFRQQTGVSPSVVPIDSTLSALLSTLADLGHLQEGSRVMLAGPNVSPPQINPPGDVARSLQELRGSGVSVDCIATHTLTAVEARSVQAEVQWLRAGYIDAVCVSSSAEAVALSDWIGDSMSCHFLVIAVGRDAGATMQQLMGSRVESVELDPGASDDEIVQAMEAHFGAGKLLF